MNTECFALPIEEARKIYKEAMDMVENSCEEVETITLYGQKLFDKTPKTCVTDVLEVEQEKTKQKEIDLKISECDAKTKRLECDAKTKQKEIEERMMPEITKQKQLDFDILKMQIELAKMQSGN
jgi:hypothetical protein